jgi:low temperature requirement protein LtrA
LWFTWFQVALFDVRFGNDSILERICKVVQFGALIGLAVEGPLFDIQNFDPLPFKIICLILMVTRIVLAIQYSITLVWCKEYKKAHLPLIGHIVAMILSAIVLIGLAFGFATSAGVHCLIGLYVLLGVEAVGVLGMSSRHDFLSLKKTNIIERLGLLTLIILGEGVIGLGEVTTKIQDFDSTCGPDIIGQIISGTLIVFFLYVLYFEQIESEGSKIGTIRQMFWALAHFPFHVCILLVVEGFSQLTIWRKVVDWIQFTENIINQLPYPSDNSTEAWEGYASQINTTLYNTFGDLEISESIEAYAQSNGNETIVGNAYYDLIGQVATFVSKGYLVEIPEGTNGEEATGGDNLDAIIGIYGTIFLYFFICAGLTLVMLAVLFLLNKRYKTRLEYISMAVRLMVGIAVTLITIMYGTTGNAFANYFLSAWMAPTVVLAYGLSKLSGIVPLLNANYYLVVLLDAILMGIGRNLVRRRGSTSKA